MHDRSYLADFRPKQNADFVYYMEDVLDLYHEPYDENRPVICFDESSKALRSHERGPLPAKPGAVERVDHWYERNGEQWIHLATEPLTGWVTVEITDRRRTTEWIDRVVELADDHYPDAECIRVAVDHLNTHNPAGFYQFFPPDEAHAYLDRFEFHYVPKKGNWLNMAEIELGVLKRQCLDRRIYYAAILPSRSLRGKLIETRLIDSLTGSSPPTTHGSSYASSIRSS
jgi:hypothetical protein